MTWIDGVGYLASILAFATFCMRTMIPLRVAAIGSNVCFVASGFSATFILSSSSISSCCR